VSSAKKISDFSFFSMTASLFVTVYEYPTFADYGKTAVFFLVICGLLWFLPLSLCSAELASIKGAQQGGIFSWVGVPLGNSNGFSAIFLGKLSIQQAFLCHILKTFGRANYPRTNLRRNPENNKQSNYNNWKRYSIWRY